MVGHSPVFHILLMIDIIASLFLCQFELVLPVFYQQLPTFPSFVSWLLPQLHCEGLSTPVLSVLHQPCDILWTVLSPHIVSSVRHFPALSWNLVDFPCFPLLGLLPVVKRSWCFSYLGMSQYFDTDFVSTAFISTWSNQIGYFYPSTFWSRDSVSLPL